jgi:tetratricopeptide (TPR) repeat protein
MLAEVAEELRAHGHRDAAAGYFSQLEGWLLRQKQPSQLRLIRVKYALGEFAEAGSALAIARKADPTSVDYLGLTALVRARITRPGADTIVKDSLEYAVRPYQFGLVSYYRARVASVAGDREGATEYLTRAISEGRSFDIGLHREIDFEPIRGFPPYERFIRSRD